MEPNYASVIAYFYTIMNPNLWQTSTNLLVLRKTKCQFDKKKKWK